MNHIAFYRLLPSVHLPSFTVPCRPFFHFLRSFSAGDTLAVPIHPSHPVGGRSMVRKLLGPVVLALAFPVLLAAQSQATTGVIRGTVTDPSGTPVAAATVVLHESQTGFQRQVATNDRGIFIAPLMPLGTYDVTARAVGLSETRRTGVRLGVGETVNLTLALAAVQLQAVVVEATQPGGGATKGESSTRPPDAPVSGPPNKRRNHPHPTVLTANLAIGPGPGR